MKTKKVLLPLLALLILTLTSFVLKPKATPSQVMVYGIVYTNQCNSEAYEYFTYKTVAESDYQQAQRNMESLLRDEYPNAKRIKVSSSRYDYGNSATNMCVIKWKSKNNNCTYEFASVSFGKTEAEALNKAIDKKNMWAGQNASYVIISQKYW